MSIKFEDVSLSYKDDDRTIIRHQNLQIDNDAGDFHFLIGASGSGKSTTLASLYFDLLPDEGRIKIDLGNKDIYDTENLTRSSIQEYRRKIGIIFQDFKLSDHFTPEQSISSVLEYLGYSKKEIKMRVDGSLSLVDLTKVARKQNHRLSGGEKQRVAAAVAFAKSPRMIIADEPTGNLDPENSINLIGYLEKYQKMMDITTIIATHDTKLLSMFDANVILVNKDKKNDHTKIFTYDHIRSQELIKQLSISSKKKNAH